MTYFVSILGIVSRIKGTEEKAKEYAFSHGANLFRICEPFGELDLTIELWWISSEKWIPVSEYNL